MHPTFIKTTEGAWLNLNEIVAIEDRSGVAGIHMTNGEEYISAEEPAALLHRTIAAITQDAL